MIDHPLLYRIFFCILSRVQLPLILGMTFSYVMRRIIVPTYGRFAAD